MKRYFLLFLLMGVLCLVGCDKKSDGGASSSSTPDSVASGSTTSAAADSDDPGKSAEDADSKLRRDRARKSLGMGGGK